MNNYSGLIVCSAGNDNRDNDTVNHYPSNANNLPYVISVGASNQYDRQWTYTDDEGNLKGSNYGTEKVDLFAPGSGIYTTFADGTYGASSGTSLAAPYVTGVAALLLSEYPDLTPCEIKDTIMSNVDINGTGFNYLCVSGGRLNAYKALTNVVRHSVTYSSIDSLYHQRICTAHNTYQTLLHNFSYRNDAITGGHICTCNQCSYTCAESHYWVTAGLKIRCSKCGAITTNAPVTPFSLSPEIRARIEQMGIGDFAMDIGGGTVLCRVGDQYYLVAGQTVNTALAHLQHELSVITPDHEAA